MEQGFRVGHRSSLCQIALGENSQKALHTAWEHWKRMQPGTHLPWETHSHLTLSVLLG